VRLVIRHFHFGVIIPNARVVHFLEDVAGIEMWNELGIVCGDVSFEKGFIEGKDARPIRTSEEVFGFIQLFLTTSLSMQLGNSSQYVWQILSSESYDAFFAPESENNSGSGQAVSLISTVIGVNLYI
jgi:hypothetical protein